MDENDLKRLIEQFGKAFFRVDQVGLEACTTSDFEWHLHHGPNAPDGKVLQGVDAVCEEIRRRKAKWKDVKYSNFENHFATFLITSTFHVSGVDENGQIFDIRAVDVYPVQGSKIARKDSFWKQIDSQ